MDKNYDPARWIPVLDTNSPEDPLLLEVRKRIQQKGVHTTVVGRKHVTLWRLGGYIYTK